MAASITWSHSSSMGALRLSGGDLVSGFVGKRGFGVCMVTFELVAPFSCNRKGQHRDRLG